jgi:hypothetical protein
MDAEPDFFLVYTLNGISELGPRRLEGELVEIQDCRTCHTNLGAPLESFARADQRQRTGLRRCRE